MEQSISIIFVHYGMNEARRELARKSLASLYESVKHLPCEILLVDNGGSLSDSKHYLEETEKGKITHYIRNSDNLWFGRGRNQALKLCEGEYIAVVDNDLIYKKGWLERCLEVLEKVGDRKLLVTPMPIIRGHRRYTSPETFNLDSKEYQINTFAGSNCWVMRYDDLENIGYFEDHHFAGTLWCRRYGKLGYSVVVVPGGLVEDCGDKKTKTFGYVREIKQSGNREVLIKKKLTNGKEVVYFKGGIWK